MFEPGTMQINNAEQKLPAWLLLPPISKFLRTLGTAEPQDLNHMRILISHTNFPAQFRRLRS